MRQIDAELESNCHDPRVVNSACRGLEHGSRRFEEAYIKARVDEFATRGTPPVPHQPVYVTILPTVHNVWENDRLNSLHAPDAVLHGGHLMHHLGVWVVTLLVTQILASCNIGAFASGTLGGGRLFHTAVWLLLMFSLNIGVWLRCYGKPAREFHLPAACLFLMAVLPGFLPRFLMATLP